jgi:hypothetical protein
MEAILWPMLDVWEDDGTNQGTGKFVLKERQ